MTTFEEQMEEIYGPIAQYSEYAVGSLVAYMDPDGRRTTGEILWIIPPGGVNPRQPEQRLPLTYVIDRAAQGGGIPDMVYATDIIGLDDGPQEPIIPGSE